MNGDLAQRIALVTHGNAALASSVEDQIDDNSTLQHVRTITFAFTPRRRLARSITNVGRVSDWFEQLAARGVRRLELDCIGRATAGKEPLPEHIAAGFAGGERSPIVARRDRSTEVWRAMWELAPGDRPADSRIWEVRYDGEELRSTVSLSHPSVPDASRQLSATLLEVEQFARSNDVDFWPGWLAGARELLTNEAPEIPYHPDLVPRDVDLSRRRLIAGATKAYVFGGMGSWNDIGFTDSAVQERYEILTALLYRSVMIAVDAATNAADS